MLFRSAHCGLDGASLRYSSLHQWFWLRPRPNAPCQTWRLSEPPSSGRRGWCATACPSTVLVHTCNASTTASSQTPPHVHSTGLSGFTIPASRIPCAVSHCRFSLREENVRRADLSKYDFPSLGIQASRRFSAKVLSTGVSFRKKYILLIYGTQ